MIIVLINPPNSSRTPTHPASDALSKNFPAYALGAAREETQQPLLIVTDIARAKECARTQVTLQQNLTIFIFQNGNPKRELPRVPFVRADPSTPPEAGSARDDNFKVLGDRRGPSTPAAKPAASAQDDNDKGGAGLQASVSGDTRAASSLPKASAQPTAERDKETADPSTPPEAGSARDDNFKVLGDRRGPSTPAAKPAASAQDDNDKGRAGLQASVSGDTRASSTLPKASAQPTAC